MNNTIDVHYPTHGVQAGAQVQFNPATHIWMVWDKYDILHRFVDIKEYAKFMSGGVA
ncbi:hypothetical protein SAMN02746068_01965 [Lactococcus chungangensis CAU 28 = DSM 22330]|uniref:Uncharacterized protein n=1 Tax=Pseudolactococcus chungangensis CAU 28 = DSM 22330 TaxID=1122154 RepID=A0A1K2HI24_9LACT|nr:hypothetical protein [Lactococcus chungangensis]SFZ76476.1 hypothetical protein SAMN02746068_01965 [Lactococcus chungangensis CAU 28 = DSM 22330]